ncbi:MAG: pyrimidine dimer DNA glycosylase/endonuclease V [Candidatus Woesearchaeota archaeon]
MVFLRLWSIHPKYLDKKGLVALWREALLAKKVLEGKTRGYKNHPQLIRFKSFKSPILAINSYLYFVYLESKKRGYNFNINKLKIRTTKYTKLIPINSGQAIFEFNHLLKKLSNRDKFLYEKLRDLNKRRLALNPVFYKVKGNDKEFWER